MSVASTTNRFNKQPHQKTYTQSALDVELSRALMGQISTFNTTTTQLGAKPSILLAPRMLHHACGATHACLICRVLTW